MSLSHTARSMEDETSSSDCIRPKLTEKVYRDNRLGQVTQRLVIKSYRDWWSSHTVWLGLRHWVTWWIVTVAQTRNAWRNANRNPEWWGDFSRLQIQIQPKSGFEFVPRDTLEFKANQNLNSTLYREIPNDSIFSMFTSWLKSSHHSGFRFAFLSRFRVSSSRERAVSFAHTPLNLSLSLSIWASLSHILESAMRERCQDTLDLRESYEDVFNLREGYEDRLRVPWQRDTKTHWIWERDMKMYSIWESHMKIDWECYARELSRCCFDREIWR